MFLQMNQLIKIKVFPHSQIVEIEAVDWKYSDRFLFSSLTINDEELTVNVTQNDHISYMRAIPVKANKEEFWMIVYFC